MEQPKSENGGGIFNKLKKVIGISTLAVAGLAADQQGRISNPADGDNHTNHSLTKPTYTHPDSTQHEYTYPTSTTYPYQDGKVLMSPELISPEVRLTIHKIEDDLNSRYTNDLRAKGYTGISITFSPSDQKKEGLSRIFTLTLEGMHGTKKEIKVAIETSTLGNKYSVQEHFSEAISKEISK